LQVSFIGFEGASSILPGSTWNPADKTSGIALSSSDAVATSILDANQGVRGTVGRSSGVYYVEFRLISGAAIDSIGLARSTLDLSSSAFASGFVGVWLGAGYTTVDGSPVTPVLPPADGDIIGVSWSGTTVQMYRNGSVYGTAMSYSAGANLFPMIGTAFSGASVRLESAATSQTYRPSGATAWG
jgi:hypothetical protein